MTVQYLLNTKDTAKPVYEVNWITMTWRVYAFSRTQYGDDFISGRINKPSQSFRGSFWKEVARPGPGYGRRVAI